MSITIMIEIIFRLSVENRKRSCIPNNNNNMISYCLLAVIFSVHYFAYLYLLHNFPHCSLTKLKPTAKLPSYNPCSKVVVNSNCQKKDMQVQR